ncbi:glycosyltransferase [Synechococcus sp. CBW1107]|nr:glycosyltransferase [Synechococcus sp. CBW1107]
MRTLLERSHYRRLEIVLIDGGELTESLLEELRFLVESQLGEKSWKHLRDGGPYDYTKRINKAAAEAHGELLLQLNDDTELLAVKGVELLIQALTKPDIGVAGALLLYPDGRVQHAGTAIDNLAPRHAWAGSRPEALPWGTLRGQRTFNAVTAAVTMCRSSLWERLGGFCDRFPINYGDVDFCLRAASLGQRTVLVPGSQWLHFESASRNLDDIPPELSVFQQIWGDCMGGPHSVDHYCSAWRMLLSSQESNKHEQI